MGLSQISNDISRIEKSISDIDRKISDESKKEGSKQSEIARVMNSMKNASLSSLQSKNNQIDRLNNDIADCRRKIGNYSNDKARFLDQLARKREEYSREEKKERDKTQKAQENLNKHIQDSRRQHNSQYSSLMPVIRFAEHQAPLQLKNVTLESTIIVETEQYDCFISHASEDKEEFVRPLAEKLKEHGIKVWYDDFAFTIGDSLRRKIDEGLARSRFGIVVLSEHFFSKNWPQKELDGLIAKETESNQKVVLPIWHKISKDDVLKHSPTLADKYAFHTSNMSLQEIVDEFQKFFQNNLS